MLGGADEDRMGSFPFVMITEVCAKWCKGGEEWDPKSVIGDLNKQRVEGRTQVGKGTRVYGIFGGVLLPKGWQASFSTGPSSFSRVLASQ